jgi:hypothetical protein
MRLVSRMITVLILTILVTGCDKRSIDVTQNVNDNRGTPTAPSALPPTAPAGEPSGFLTVTPLTGAVGPRVFQYECYNSTTNTADGDLPEWKGSKQLRDSVTIDLKTPGTYTVRNLCANGTKVVPTTPVTVVVTSGGGSGGGGGGGGGGTTPAPQIQPPTCRITANVTSVNANTSVILTTVTQNTTSIRAVLGNWPATIPINGPVSVVPPVGSTPYQVSCKGDGGEVLSNTITLSATTQVQIPNCPTTGDYTPAGGTVYVNRNTTLTFNPGGSWPNNCQVIYYTNKPDVLKVLGADAVYQVCDTGGSNCVWYYAGLHATLTGVFSGSGNVCSAVISIGSDDKWRFAPNGEKCHAWTSTNPPASITTQSVDTQGADPAPRVHDDPRVSQTRIN